MRRLIGILLCVSMITVINNCREASGPTLSNAGKGGGTPDKVTNVKVQNFPGGAHVFYTLPESKSLSYVKAEYSTKNNGKQEARASRFTDSLTVDGFAESTAHEIKLYSYSLNENHSDPVTVSVNPLTSPFKTVFKTISLENNFGGVKVHYGDNISNAELTIAIVNDSLGEVLSVQNNYISKQEGTYSVRGLDPKPYKLGYYVRDKFQNRSDTVFSNFIPLFEKELDKNKFSNAKLPTDSWEEPTRGNFSMIWDNAAPREKYNNWYSRNLDSFPAWVTIDLGQKVKISRIILYGHEHYGLYNNAYSKDFELWGSADPNIDDGKAFDSSWTKLGSYDTSLRVTNPDIEVPYPENGEEYAIPGAANKPYIRYLRFKVLSSWSGQKRMNIAEIDVFGSPLNGEEGD